MHTKHYAKGVSIIPCSRFPAGCFLIMCLLAGCNNPLEKVTKDWCKVIRASQVIPVYPLTEDLQPGDVFLVTQSVQDQAKQYNERGFLPFDYHVARLNITELPKGGYKTFYQSDYWQGEYANIPHSRPYQSPSDGNTPVQTFAVPRAAFPSYTFEVKNGQGLQLALPVQGVPVGLNLLNATSAAGTITIADAYTYGIDAHTLANVLRNKVESDTDLQAELAGLIAAHSRVQLYLRVIYRVYLSGSVNITLQRTSDYGVLGEIGATFAGRNSTDKPLDPNNLKNYADAFKAISGDAKLPWGGAIKLTGSSSSSVTLKEKFDRPLIFGYMGVDMPALSDGTLGIPVATSTLLYNPSQEPPVAAGGPTSPALREVEGRLFIIQSLCSKKPEKTNFPGKQLLWVDSQLGKPKELKDFRKSCAAGADFTETMTLFREGCLDYQCRIKNNIQSHKKIIIVLDKVIDRLEGKKT